MNQRYLALVAILLPMICFGTGPAAPTNIRVEMQCVAIPEELAVPMVAELMDPHKVEGAYGRIQKLLAAGTAKLIGWPMVTTLSGQRAVVEAIDEFRYATEYSAPVVSFTPSLDPKETAKIEPKADVSAFDETPTAFETRNLGVTLEVEPILSPDGATIKLDVVPQHIRLKGMLKQTVDRAAGGKKATVEQPEFDTMKVTTSLTLRSGQRMLLGVFRSGEYPKHLEFFILKAEALKAE